MKTVLTYAATVAALCGAAPFAHAAPVLSLVQTGFANAGTDATLTTAGGPSVGTFRAGEFTGVVDGASFLSYCIDLAQHFYFGAAYGNYPKNRSWSYPVSAGGGVERGV